MKKLILISAALILIISCVENKKEMQNDYNNANTVKNANEIINKNDVDMKLSKELQVERLKYINNQYRITLDKKLQIQLLDSFFMLFPEHFSLLIDLYGYKEICIDSTSYGPLYNYSYSHIELLYKSEEIVGSNLFIRKIIDISLNGYWQSDAVAIFKEYLFDLLLSNKKLFCSKLNEYNEQDIESFWKFYFDEPHPENLDFNELDNFKQLDSKMYCIIKSSHDDALKRSRKTLP